MTNLLSKRFSYLEFSGKCFSPKKYEKLIEYPLYMKIEPDESQYYLKKENPFYGKPSEFGSAILQPPYNVKYQRKWIFNKIQIINIYFKNVNIDEIVFWEVDITPIHSQKNYGLNIEELTILSKYNISYCLSVYDKEKNEKLPYRLWKKRNWNDHKTT